MGPPHAPHDLGRFGEERARNLLIECGWTVLAANYRFGRREVDLVVRRRGVVAFVEVKTRAGSGYGRPEEAVTRLKRREIEIVATEFLHRHRLRDVEVRFDVVAVVADHAGRVRRITHLEDAWRPEAPR